MHSHKNRQKNVFSRSCLRCGVSRLLRSNAVQYLRTVAGNDRVGQSGALALSHTSANGTPSPTVRLLFAVLVCWCFSPSRRRSARCYTNTNAAPATAQTPGAGGTCVSSIATVHHSAPHSKRAPFRTPENLCMHRVCAYRGIFLFCSGTLPFFSLLLCVVWSVIEIKHLEHVILLSDGVVCLYGVVYFFPSLFYDVLILFLTPATIAFKSASTLHLLAYERAYSRKMASDGGRWRFVCSYATIRPLVLPMK